MPSHDHCRLPLCKNRREKCLGLIFHTFPRVGPFRSRWVVAIKRDVRPHLKITSNTKVCSEHFLESDFYIPLSASEMEQGVRCRLKSDAVPSQFVFRHLPTARPTPFDRQRAAAERRAKANMPNFGPKKQLETVEEELSEARKRIAHLEEANASLQGNLDVLKSQVFRYENI